VAGEFEAVAFLLVFRLEQPGKDNGEEAEADEDGHGQGVVVVDDGQFGGDAVHTSCDDVLAGDAEGIEDPADEVGGPHEGDEVLEEEDKGVCGAELTFGDELGNRGPHGGRDEGETDAQQEHRKVISNLD